MDEMNLLENQLQSWKPRRPSPEIARRLFGPAELPSLRPARPATAWNWLSPVAACALTMLVAVHTANRVPGRLVSGSNATLFASIMLDAAVTSNLASFSTGQADQNMEYNVWNHATHHVAEAPRLAIPVRREREVFSVVPTNS
jgi:hypothetical protein